MREKLPRRPTGGLDPRTGGVILGLDWLLFGTNALSGLALTPLLIFVGATLAFVATYRIERQGGTRGRFRAASAAVFSAIVVGLPFPLAGTAVGGAILMLSGLRRGKVRR
ncbi:MAG: phosphoribosylaminoimidazole carboxylase [Myxococcota bacterium]|nr:phosphoribosylaminoimidazole carboxylase [Myxococcota bacterium]